MLLRNHQTKERILLNVHFLIIHIKLIYSSASSAVSTSVNQCVLHSNREHEAWYAVQHFKGGFVSQSKHNSINEPVFDCRRFWVIQMQTICKSRLPEASFWYYIYCTSLKWNGEDHLHWLQSAHQMVMEGLFFPARKQSNSLEHQIIRYTIKLRCHIAAIDTGHVIMPWNHCSKTHWLHYILCRQSSISKLNMWGPNCCCV